MRQCVSWFLTEFNSSTTIFTYDGAGGRGTTTFTYDAVDRLTQKTKGSGDYETYTYDAADQKTSIGYWFSDGTQHNALVYGYDPAGNVQSVNQGYYATTYGYDGADQLTSETSTGGSPPPTLGYTYDHNGNRLTQTSGGAQVQSFSYDAHDKLTSGTSGNETDGYDANGNETSVTIGGATYRFAYDDEDRLTSLTFPGGTADTFSYNGLGLRVGKTDSTGIYAYVCDGTTPGADVLADGLAVYTPGLSDHRGSASTFSHSDLLGSLRFLTDSGQNVTANLLPDAFGETVSQAGTVATPFGWNGASGYQSDSDGLNLLGHRYYNSRTGRFITQDHAKSGGNWYAYAGNNPINRSDPLGLYWGGGTVPSGLDANDPTEMAAYAEWMQASPGQTFDVTTSNGNSYSFTIPGGGQSISGDGISGLGLGLGIAGEFVHGTTNHTRNYGPTSTQARNMRNSAAYRAILLQIMNGQTSGGLNSPEGLLATALDYFANGTEAQLGSFAWAFTNSSNSNMGIDITNDITFNSLFLHQSSILRAGFKTCERVVMLK